MFFSNTILMENKDNKKEIKNTNDKHDLQQYRANIYKKGLKFKSDVVYRGQKPIDPIKKLNIKYNSTKKPKIIKKEGIIQKFLNNSFFFNNFSKSSKFLYKRKKNIKEIEEKKKRKNRSIFQFGRDIYNYIVVDLCYHWVVFLFKIVFYYFYNYEKGVLNDLFMLLMNRQRLGKKKEYYKYIRENWSSVHNIYAIKELNTSFYENTNILNTLWKKGIRSLIYMDLFFFLGNFENDINFRQKYIDFFEFVDMIKTIILILSILPFFFMWLENYFYNFYKNTKTKVNRLYWELRKQEVKLVIFKAHKVYNRKSRKKLVISKYKNFKDFKFDKEKQNFNKMKNKVWVWVIYLYVLTALRFIYVGCKSMGFWLLKEIVYISVILLPGILVKLFVFYPLRYISIFIKRPLIKLYAYISLIFTLPKIFYKIFHFYVFDERVRRIYYGIYLNSIFLNLSLKFNFWKFLEYRKKCKDWHNWLNFRKRKKKEWRKYEKLIAKQKGILYYYYLYIEDQYEKQTRKYKKIIKDKINDYVTWIKNFNKYGFKHIYILTVIYLQELINKFFIKIYYFNKKFVDQFPNKYFYTYLNNFATKKYFLISVANFEKQDKQLNKQFVFTFFKYFGNRLLDIRYIFIIKVLINCLNKNFLRINLHKKTNNVDLLSTFLIKNIFNKKQLWSQYVSFLEIKDVFYLKNNIEKQIQMKRNLNKKFWGIYKKTDHVNRTKLTYLDIHLMRYIQLLSTKLIFKSYKLNDQVEFLQNQLNKQFQWFNKENKEMSWYEKRKLLDDLEFKNMPYKERYAVVDRIGDNKIKEWNDLEDFYAPYTYSGSTEKYDYWEGMVDIEDYNQLEEHMLEIELADDEKFELAVNRGFQQKIIKGNNSNPEKIDEIYYTENDYKDIFTDLFYYEGLSNWVNQEKIRNYDHKLIMKDFEDLSNVPLEDKIWDLMEFDEFTTGESVNAEHDSQVVVVIRIQGEC